MSATTLALVLQSFVLTAHPAAALASPGLTVTASPSTSVGLQIWANSNLMGTSNPTGTITFNAFSPDDTTCSSSMFTSAVPVTGTSVNSARFTTTKAGTYRWVAAYSGDATYSPATSTCNQASSTVVVAKANTVLSIAAPAPVGNAIHGRATLGGGSSPTGTITFSLAPPGDTFCSAPPVFGATVAVNGAGAYDSPPFTATQSGSYKWRAIYGGDANNIGTTLTPCLDANAAVTVTVTAATPPPAAQTNIAVFRPSEGSWYFQGQSGTQWGTSGDIPVAGDYNGDGKPDIAVYRPSNGSWYVQGQAGAQWGGVAGDVPVAADYNGDGKTDIAIYRPASGSWYVQGQPGAQWGGAAGDVPVPADYNGDGKDDIAIYRPSTGTWFIQGSDGTNRTVLWGGVAGDIPVPADYTGDGKADIAIYRPSTGTWFIQGQAGSVWGTATDLPLPVPASTRMFFF